jgi:PAS domain S-box-containing protein
LKPVKSAELRSAIEVSRYRVALERRARAAELALRASEARYRFIVENAREGICTTDAFGAFTYVNPKLEEMLGYASGELLGKRLEDLVDVEWRELVREKLVLRQAGVSEGWEFRAKAKDGRDVWLWSEANAVMIDGVFTGLLALVTDVTEERLAQQAREKMQAKALVDDRLKTVGLLAAGVGHEINNPLTFIIWNLELLARRLRESTSPGAQATELEEMVVEAREGADRVSRIVKSLRTFAKADVHAHERGLVDVRLVVELSMQMAASELHGRARLVNDFGETPLVSADEARLGQLVLSLLVNAAQSIEPGEPEVNEVRVVVGTDGEGRAFIEVRDTGCGIPDDIKGRIFDPFFTTKDIGEGKGLGLSVCHGIATALGGEITVESAVGKGSTFRVVLPRATSLALGRGISTS